jgi:UDP-N-acetylglucosamine 2-epimerase (non-hydrolysing)
VIADLHFAPTELNRQNLLREGISDRSIKVTGNTVIDALQYIVKLPPPPQVETWLNEWGIISGQRRLILVTAHRRENFGEPIRSICQSLRSLAERYGDSIRILYPVHLNPNIQGPVYELLNNIPQVILTQPVDYLSLVHLMKAAHIVLTDSGGIQEEATGLGKPTLVLREKTERPEGLEAGVLKLVGSDPQKILHEASLLMDDEKTYTVMAHAANPFGDGKAAGRIVQAITDYSE